MRRQGAALVGALALAGATLAVTTCGYPEFKYADEGGSGGEGGDGSGAGPVATVPCGETMSQECLPGQVCCFHQMTAALDHCGDPMSCGPGYDEFYCNTSADCPGGICCRTDNGVSLLIQCQTTCSGPAESPMCTVPEECASMSCVSILTMGIYPGYSFCN